MFLKKKNEENNGMLYFGMCFINMKLILDMVIFCIVKFCLILWIFWIDFDINF